MEPIQAAILESYKRLGSNLNRPLLASNGSPRQQTNLSNPELLTQSLNTLPLFIAFSGGLDSAVLLHAASHLNSTKQLGKVAVVHVDHGLQSSSEDWLPFCRKIAQQYSHEFYSTSLQLADKGKTSEKDARDGRYSFFESLLIDGKVIAMAHHQDDQTETLLFRLIRGTGLHGLRGMPESRALGNGWLLRPLLSFKREQLEDYASRHHLDWIEDPTNQQHKYSRNYLRNKVVPVIEKRWPSFSQSFQQLTVHAKEQIELLDLLAKEDYSILQVRSNVLNLSSFNQLSIARRKNLLRYWVNIETGFTVSIAELNQVVNQVQTEKPKNIKTKASSGWFRVFDQQLYFCGHEEPAVLLEKVDWVEWRSPIELRNEVVLNASGLESSNQDDSLLVREPNKTEIVNVRPRCGGEKVQPSYRNHSTELKKIYQELKVPHWEREWLPLVYYDDTLVAVPGVFVNKEFQTKKNGLSFAVVSY
ncbi:MAG: tRNA lysidine(34) synthetase TilS [Kangiellaceae bacterium]|nr:tRNA lysidine(34) synthetase TilS [Kangiellaceae bacterium]